MVALYKQAVFWPNFGVFYIIEHGVLAMDGVANYYQKGLELAEAGRHKEAMEYIQKYLAHAPDDGQAVNDAGAILHCLGRSDEAID